VWFSIQIQMTCWYVRGGADAQPHGPVLAVVSVDDDTAVVEVDTVVGAAR
jgi:hypothetical protein